MARRREDFCPQNAGQTIGHCDAQDRTRAVPQGSRFRKERFNPFQRGGQALQQVFGGPGQPQWARVTPQQGYPDAGFKALQMLRDCGLRKPKFNRGSGYTPPFRDREEGLEKFEIKGCIIGHFNRDNWIFEFREAELYWLKSGA